MDIKYKQMASLYSNLRVFDSSSDDEDSGIPPSESQSERSAKPLAPAEDHLDFPFAAYMRQIVGKSFDESKVRTLGESSEKFSFEFPELI